MSVYSYTQLSKYKELKELVRKRIGMLIQQQEKMQWEQKGDEEKMSFDKRRQKEIEVLMKCYRILLKLLLSSLFFTFLYMLALQKEFLHSFCLSFYR